MVGKDWRKPWGRNGIEVEEVAEKAENQTAGLEVKVQEKMGDKGPQVQLVPLRKRKTLRLRN